MKRSTISILAVFSFAAAAALAQTPTAPTKPAATGKTIQQRKANQQKRVGEGVENGSLTAGEAAKVEKKEERLNGEERDMREDNGGKLTTADKAKLTRQQNQLSKDIYKQKHDAQVQPKTGNEVNKRDRNQQKRIGEGLENGSLTAGEATKLEKKESKLNAEQHDMREDNGGRLTASEKVKVNRQQNRVSKQIYKKKHNARKRG
ncbi:MAG TPA: hypothetical protein VJN64_00760 [Terriglobales bacterium]|nr:hypothetical protein [Terriglobales bacterium]